MTDDIRRWRTRIFILLLVGGALTLLLQTGVLGLVFGLGFGGSSTMFMLMASMVSTAVIGLFTEALPVALFAPPAGSKASALHSGWKGGYLLAWLAMTGTAVLASLGSAGLIGLKDMADGGARLVYPALSALGMVAGSYAFFGILNRRFAGSAWPSDWQQPVWWLAGIQLGGLLIMVVGLGAVTSQGLATAVGYLMQIAQAVAMAVSLAQWRTQMERGRSDGSLMVF